jgi:hypothetical protein
MTGVGVAEMAAINKQEYFANSGYVGSKSGSRAGKDNRTVNAKDGELFLNGRDQSTLLSMLKNGYNNAKNATSLYIENFSGNDDDMGRLEDMLYRLNTNGRISDVVFS